MTKLLRIVAEASRARAAGCGARPIIALPLAIAVLVGLAPLGCGSASSGNADPVTAECLSRKPSVSTGVYGCVTSSDDVGTPMPPQALPAFTIEAFDSQPPPTPDDGLAPAATASSDAVGYFEIQLTPGTHWLCTTFRRCVSVDVNQGSTQAHNYDFGPGPGW